MSVRQFAQKLIGLLTLVNRVEILLTRYKTMTLWTIYWMLLCYLLWLQTKQPDLNIFIIVDCTEEIERWVHFCPSYHEYFSNSYYMAMKTVPCILIELSIYCSTIKPQQNPEEQQCNNTFIFFFLQQMIVFLFVFFWLPPGSPRTAFWFGLYFSAWGGSVVNSLMLQFVVAGLWWCLTLTQ